MDGTFLAMDDGDKIKKMWICGDLTNKKKGHNKTKKPPWI